MKRLVEDGRQVWEVTPSVAEPSSDILTEQKPFHEEYHGFDLYSVQRYWNRRFEFWPNFSNGICTDTVGLFSVTPWDAAVQIAQTLDEYYPNDSPLIIDACCGVGGNTVAFARCIETGRIIGIDSDSTRIVCAKNNSNVSGTGSRTDFVRDDAINFVASLRGSARFVFSSPPWGGPGYTIKTLEDLPFDVFSLMEAAISGCVEDGGRLALFMPRDFPAKEARRLVKKGTKLSKFDVTSGPRKRLIASCFVYGKYK
ncbi:hypothetical protein TRFO_10855 [Tritrichomonas foetus]|uniref:Trimethylguanosine synthase n=1 Tax=Tritrichomonas foetus TaxID=1144522 RepID=A0A1J4J896_9EUKA|nr:hypothetical protein TRFO_10855 [Tritrichomonas foetus]|eukprot:OHS94905.1 hypothetical protein TRFO_10855 [Tritrichomonas foetus]